MPKQWLGILLTIVSMFCFATVYAFYKACEPYLSNAQVLTFANFSSWIMILPFVFKDGVKSLRTPQLPMIALRTVLGLSSVYFLTKGLTTTSLSEMTLLNNTAPLFIPFIVWALYKTKIPAILGWGLAIGFAGIFIVLRPDNFVFNKGLLYGLMSGISAAGMIVAARKIAYVPFLTILFYYFLIIFLAVSPSLLFPWVVPPGKIWLFLALAGFGMIGAQIALAAALRYINSHDMAPFIYTCVIFAALIDWIVWHVTPGLVTTLGMVVIAIGGTMTTMRSAPKE